MEDETVVNGGEPVFDATPIGISKKDRYADENNEVSELYNKIGILEGDNFGQSEEIKRLMQLVEEFKKNRSEMEEKMQGKIDQSENDQRTLESIAARAAVLETENSRLQHDLVTSMTEGEEAVAELRQLQDSLEVLRRSSGEKDSNISVLERERASLMKQMETESKEMQGVKAEMEKTIRDLEEKFAVSDNQKTKLEEQAKAKLLEKDSEIVKLQKELDGLKSMFSESLSALKKSLEEKEVVSARVSTLEDNLKQSEEKFRAMELNIYQLQNDLRESKENNLKLEEKLAGSAAEISEMEKKVLQIEEEFGKGEGKETIGKFNGMKFLWPTAAAASTGTVAAAAAFIYLKYARQN